MNPRVIQLPEVQFCLRYLYDYGIKDGTSYDSCIAGIKENIKKFRLVPVQEEDFFTELAAKMRELWPTGKKDGKYDWRSPVKELADRLRLVWSRRNLSGYTIDDCLVVCRQYLSSYQTNTKYMKTLKYFIIRQKTLESMDKDGKFHYSYESEFANMLENLTDEERQRAKDEAIVEAMSADCGGVLI